MEDVSPRIRQEAVPLDWPQGSDFVSCTTPPYLHHLPNIHGGTNAAHGQVMIDAHRVFPPAPPPRYSTSFETSFQLNEHLLLTNAQQAFGTFGLSDAVANLISDRKLHDLYQERFGDDDDDDDGVSPYHTTILKSHLGTLKKESKTHRILVERCGKMKYSPTNPFARQLLGHAAVMSPQTSQEKMEVIVNLARLSVLTELELVENGITLEMIAKSGPKYKLFGTTITDNAADSLLLLRRDLLRPGTKVFINFDKGPKGDFVKIVSWFDFARWKVRTFMIDIDKSGGSSKEAAAAIKHSTERLELGSDFRYAGFTADSGGGGTGKSVGSTLQALYLVTDDGLVLIGYCSLHCLQVCLKNPCEQIIGTGGIDKRNAIQMIHATFDLQEIVEMPTWRKHFQEASAKLVIEIKGKTGEVVQKLQAPILTRWWTVGEAAKFIGNNIELLKEVTLKCLKMKRVERDEKMYKIASRLYSLLMEDTIVSDLKLVYCYNCYFVNPHFDWMQKGDDRIGGMPGFLGRHMLVRYFLMRSDLLRWTNGKWNDCQDMKQFVDTIPDEETDVDTIPDDAADPGPTIENQLNDANVLLDDIKARPVDNPSLQRKKADDFMKMGLEYLDKHFARYTKELLFLGLFGESPTASLLATKLLNPNIPLAEDNGTTYHCDYHGRDIDLKAFAKFLNESVDCDDARNCPHVVKLGQDRLEKIASDISIWADDAPTPHVNIKNYYCEHYAAFATTTHFVEAGVKIAKIANNNARDELRMTHYAIGSNLIEEINELTVKYMLETGKYKDTNNIKPRGEYKVLETAKYLTARSKDLEVLLSNPVEQAIWSRMRSCLSDTTKSFKKQRDTQKMDEFGDQIQKRDKLQGNKLAHQQGYDTTDLLSGNTIFSQMTKANHLELLKEELSCRNVTYDATVEGFQKLRSKLRWAEVQLRTGQQVFAEYQATKGFAPLWKPAEWAKLRPVDSDSDNDI